MKKNDYVEILKSYDPKKKKSYWTSTSKEGLEFYYDEIMMPDLMESNLPSIVEDPTLSEIYFDKI